MTKFLIAIAVVGYILLSAFVETESDTRIVPADIFLVALSAIALLLSVRRGVLVVPPVHLALLPLLGVFLVSSIFARDSERAGIELIAILIGFLGSLALINLMVDLPEATFRRFCRFFVLAMGLLALICLLDFLLFPGLISSRNLGGLQGPFRNSGQAGSYFGIVAAISIALVMGGLVPRRIIYLAAVFAITLAMFATIKRAASIGLLAGLALMLVQMLFSPSTRDKKFAVASIVFGGGGLLVGLGLFGWAIQNVPDMRWRFEYKVSADGIDNFSEGFFLDNIRSTLAALSDSPLIGVGLDNVREFYQYHEIHSTYLAVLAYGGLLGAVAYVFFILSLLRSVRSGVATIAANAYSSTLYYFFPLLLGLMVSWGYTYHLRKREFWIMIVFIVLLRMLSERRKRVLDQTQSEAPSLGRPVRQ